MNTTHDVIVPFSRMAARMTLNVRLTGARMGTVRITLGIALLKLATKVMGCNVNIDTNIK
jgi:hypothetical protein